MKNYLLFGGSHYYPLGGMKDYIGEFDTRDDALRHLVFADVAVDWYQIVSSLTMEVFETGGRKYA